MDYMRRALYGQRQSPGREQMSEDLIEDYRDHHSPPPSSPKSNSVDAMDIDGYDEANSDDESEGDEESSYESSSRSSASEASLPRETARRRGVDGKTKHRSLKQMAARAAKSGATRGPLSKFASRSGPLRPTLQSRARVASGDTKGTQLI